MTRYAIGLGSNQDDRVDHMRAGVTALRELGQLVAVSPLYESEPVGGPEQAQFLNAVIVIESDLPADELLVELHAIEESRARLRTVRWGPRTLDLDIITSDGPVVDSADLTIPHAESANRRFVLQPLVDIWPEASVAGGLSAGEALFGIEGQDVERLARRWAGEPD